MGGTLPTFAKVGNKLVVGSVTGSRQAEQQHKGALGANSGSFNRARGHDKGSKDLGYHQPSGLQMRNKVPRRKGTFPKTWSPLSRVKPSGCVPWEPCIEGKVISKQLLFYERKIELLEKIQKKTDRNKIKNHTCDPETTTVNNLVCISLDFFLGISVQFFNTFSIVLYMQNQLTYNMIFFMLLCIMYVIPYHWIFFYVTVYMFHGIPWLNI